MTSTPASLFITADRDSVCAGDDIESHERPFAVPPNASVPELIHLATKACELAGITGGNATWIVEAGGSDGKPIAVVAQQWEEPRLLVRETATAESIFGEHKSKLLFKYWGQANPDAVFNALASNRPLPNRFGQAPNSQKTQARLIGLLIFAIGVGGVAYNWYSVLMQGVYGQKASVLFPFFACLGLSMMLYPMSKAESLAIYGSKQMPWKHIPIGQKLLIVLGIVLGVLQWALFNGHIPI